MAVVSMNYLLEAGVHFGHQTKRWNPKMKEYIFTSRDDIYIIDLQKTAKAIEEAYVVLNNIAKNGGKVLFVGTKKQAQDATKEEAIRSNSYYVTERWLGGTLTNFKTIRRRVKRLEEIENMEKEGLFEVLPKKEVSGIKKEYNNFVEEQDNLWLEDYANYDVLSRRFGAYWPNWDKKLQTAPEDAKAEGISLKDKILNVLGHKIDKNFKPTKVSGCPSKKAYPYTQVWGHALYNYDSPEFWEYHEASLKQLLRNADLRLDHFVGYVNRAAIPVEYKKADGTVLKGNDIFKPVKDGGMGEGFFDNSWIEDIYNKKNPKGENVFEVFIRVAKELGLKPEETYVLEDFGPLAKTKAYKDFRKKFGKNFISQHVPVGMDICDPKNRKHLNKNVAILTGNHDMPPLREFVDKLMDGNLNKRAKKKFETFCKKELNLTEEEMNSKDAVYENLLKWHYTNDVKQVQTTLQDALGIYFRPNIPGFWNGMMDKFLMKTTPEALLPYWSRVFPKDFLTRDNQSGINPGYKSLADKFIQMMKELYSTK